MSAGHQRLGTAQGAAAAPQEQPAAARMAEVAGRVSPRSGLRRRVRLARSGVLFAAALLRALPAHGLWQLARLPVRSGGSEPEKVSLRIPPAARVPLDRVSDRPCA